MFTVLRQLLVQHDDQKTSRRQRDICLKRRTRQNQNSSWSQLCRRRMWTNGDKITVQPGPYHSHVAWNSEVSLKQSKSSRSREIWTCSQRYWSICGRKTPIEMKKTRSAAIGVFHSTTRCWSVPHGRAPSHCVFIHATTTMETDVLAETPDGSMTTVLGTSTPKRLSVVSTEAIKIYTSAGSQVSSCQPQTPTFQTIRLEVGMLACFLLGVFWSLTAEGQTVGYAFIMPELLRVT